MTPSSSPSPSSDSPPEQHRDSNLTIDPIMDPAGHQVYSGLPLSEQDILNFRIQTFCSAPASDTPWHHPEAIVPTGHALPTSARPPSGLADYRNPQPISECGTFPRDSGYGGSGPTCGESAPSVNEGDVLLDVQQIDQFQGFFDAGIGLSNLMLGPGLVHAEAAHLRSEARFYCHFCNKDVNTKAQLNKHIQRHGKPHTCPYLNCKKSRPGCGFGTPNDLLRHKRTVHKEVDGSGLPFYVCPYEPCTHKKDQKRWPRLDNFRNHLMRQHPQFYKEKDDWQNYTHRPPQLRRANVQEVEQGLGSLDADTDYSGVPFLQGSNGQPLGDHVLPDASPLMSSVYQEQAAAPASLSGQFPSVSEWSPLPASSDVTPDTRSQCFAPDHTLSETFNGPLSYSMPDLSLDGDLSTDAFPEMFEGCGETLDDVAAEEEASACVDYLEDMGRENGAWTNHERLGTTSQCEIDEFNLALSESDKATNDSAPDGSLTNVLAKTLIEARSDPSRLIEILKQLPPQLLESALKREQGLDGKDDREDANEADRKAEEAREEANPKGYYKCPHCAKAFSRRCELKKHSKRHAKPYGCTFRKCTKAFGSKNDWKRHESNQHEVLEKWTCDVPGCRKVRRRREAFRRHLVGDHGLAGEPRLVEEKLERCRMGRHCDPRFWCGFCVRVVHISEPSVNTWTRRCDHIDNHLFGKGGLAKKTMQDWVFLEEEEHDDDDNDDYEQRDDDGDEGTGAPALGTHGRGKRKAEEPLLEHRLRHKKHKESILMWHCCNCSNAIGHVLKLASSCIDCNHIKCLHCAEEMVTSVDDECQVLPRSGGEE